MGELAVTVVKWIVRFTIIITVILSFSVLMSLTWSMTSILLNQTVLDDILIILQLWMPFDLDVLLAWVFTSTILYITYRMSIFFLGLTNRFLG